MKKILYLILTLLLIFSIAGCSGQQTSETDMSLDDMIGVIQLSQQELPELTHITHEDVDFTTWLSDYYFMQPEQVADGVICYADGVEASEIVGNGRRKELQRSRGGFERIYPESGWCF